MLSVYRGTTLLADGNLAGQGICSRFGNPGRVLVDPSQKIGADFTAWFTRGNDEHTITLVVETEHGTRSLARTHKLTHGQTIRGTADLILAWTEDSVDYVATCADAAWGEADIVQQGISTIATYQINGGQWVITEDGDAVSTSNFTEQVLTPSAAGGTLVTMAAAHRHASLRVTPTSFSGTHDVDLPTTNRQDGDVVEVRINMPASANPTVRICNGDGGSALRTRVGIAAGATTWLGKYVFETSAWVEHFFINITE